MLYFQSNKSSWIGHISNAQWTLQLGRAVLYWGQSRDQNGHCLCPHTVYSPGWEADNKEVKSFQSGVTEEIMHPNYRDWEADLDCLGSQKSLSKAEIQIRRH